MTGWTSVSAGMVVTLAGATAARCQGLTGTEHVFTVNGSGLGRANASS